MPVPRRRRGERLGWLFPGCRLVALAILAGLAITAWIAACATRPGQTHPVPDASGRQPPEAVRYVALGDSYTIGTSVREEERWPNQLVARLAERRDPPPLALVANLAVNGYTSQDVIDDELARLDRLDPGFVTLLVGVNDVVQGVPPDRYEENVRTIVADLLARLPATRVIAVSTPDYTVTPQGAAFGDPRAQSEGIRRNNAILAEVCAENGIAFVDIHDISLEAASDRSLVARDGLHPSGAQYARWVDRIEPEVERLFGLARVP